jgi:hypothetical protein
MLPSSAAANRAWVRNRIARAGLTTEIEMRAAHLTAYGLEALYEPLTPDEQALYDAWNAGEYLADVFAESAEDYRRYDLPERWQESDAHPEG